MAGIDTGRPPQSTAIHGSGCSRGRWHGGEGGREGGTQDEREERLKGEGRDAASYLHMHASATGYCRNEGKLQGARECPRGLCEQPREIEGK